MGKIGKIYFDKSQTFLNIRIQFVNHIEFIDEKQLFAT